VSKKMNRTLSIGLLIVGYLGMVPTLHAQSDTPLKLPEAYEIALENNENIEVARTNQAIAGENVTQAKSSLYPQLDLRGQSYRQKERVSPGPGINLPNKETIWGADLTQPLYQGGELWFGLNRAQYERQRVRYQTYRRKQQVLLQVAETFYGVILAQRNVEIAENALERAQSQLDRAQARYEVGRATKNAVLRAEVDVAEARQQQVEARNQVDVAGEDLAVVLGVNNTDWVVREPESRDFADTGVQSLVRRAYQARRDLRESERNIKSAYENVRYQMADYYPDLSLVGSFDKTNQPSFGTPEEDWRVTLQGSYPLFSGWQETSEVDQAQLQYRNARTNHQRLRRAVRRDVRQAHSNYRTQQSVVETIQQQVQSARENYREISAQFEEGLVDSADVSDALTTLNEAELRLASARNTLRLDRLRLELAIGTFAESHLEKGPNHESP
jgi:outer membrane protein